MARLRKAAVVAAVTATVVAVSACSSGPATPDDPVLAEGQQIFLARCASCHGAEGGGGLGPRLAGRMTQRFPDIADQITLVTNGVRGTNMRAFGEILSAEQINAVVRYTREAL